MSHYEDRYIVLKLTHYRGSWTPCGVGTETDTFKTEQEAMKEAKEWLGC